MLRAAVFDLDHTLFDPRSLPLALFGALEARLRVTAAGLIPPALLEAAVADAWVLPFDRVVSRHQLPTELTGAWKEAMSGVEVSEPLYPYPDIHEGLQRLPLLRLLLTTGFRRLQEGKIQQLGLTSLFEAVYIDALDPPGSTCKRAVLEQILVEHELAPSEVVVVGDRADDELAAALALGMFAVQVLRPGVIPSSEIAWQVTDLRELPGLFTRMIEAAAA